MTHIIIIEELNTKIFDVIMNEVLLNNSLFSNTEESFNKIEIQFMNILDDKTDEAYPKFEHKLGSFNDPLLIKAEIAGYLYLHHMYNDIEDDYIDHYIVTISSY